MLDFARQQSGTNPQLSGDPKNIPAETPSQKSPEHTRAQEGYPVKELSACTQHISVPKLKRIGLQLLLSILQLDPCTYYKREIL